MICQRPPFILSDNLKPLDPATERAALQLVDVFKDLEIARDQITRRERTRHGER